MSQEIATRRAVAAAPLSWLRLLLCAVATIAIVCGLCFAMGLARGPLFAVRNVQVIAPTLSVACEVADSLHMPGGASTLFTPMDSIVQAATACPRVKHVQISRELPGMLTVTIEERKPIAALGVQSGYVMVDDQGFALERCQQPPAKLPVFLGFAGELRNPGDRLDQGRLARLTGCAAASKPLCGRGLFVIDFTDPNAISCRLPDGVVGKLGANDNLRSKLSLFTGIYQGLKAQGKQPLYVDVRIMQRPVWMPKDSRSAAGEGGSNGVG